MTKKMSLLTPKDIKLDFAGLELSLANIMLVLKKFYWLMGNKVAS